MCLLVKTSLSFDRHATRPDLPLWQPHVRTAMMTVITATSATVMESTTAQGLSHSPKPKYQHGCVFIERTAKFKSYLQSRHRAQDFYVLQKHQFVREDHTIPYHTSPSLPHPACHFRLRHFSSMSMSMMSGSDASGEELLRPLEKSSLGCHTMFLHPVQRITWLR